MCPLPCQALEIQWGVKAGTDHEGKDIYQKIQQVKGEMATVKNASK